MNGAKIRKRRKEGKHAESNQGERKTGKYKGNIKKKTLVNPFYWFSIEYDI